MFDGASSPAPPTRLPVRSHVDFAWSEGKATFNSTVSDTDTIS